MGYACPVCESPQVDGRHLANHVAFTALTGDDAHERWLAETVPGWGEMGENELADVVLAHATETEVADGFDDEGGTAPAVDRQEVPSPDLDGDAASILAEAREYTRQMAGGADGDTGGGEGSDAEGEGGDGEDEAGDAEGEGTDGGDGSEDGDANTADEIE
jgi:hypothetical protein